MAKGKSAVLIFALFFFQTDSATIKQPRNSQVTLIKSDDPEAVKLRRLQRCNPQPFPFVVPNYNPYLYQGESQQGQANCGLSSCSMLQHLLQVQEVAKPPKPPCCSLLAPLPPPPPIIEEFQRPQSIQDILQADCKRLDRFSHKPPATTTTTPPKYAYQELSGRDHIHNMDWVQLRGACGKNAPPQMCMGENSELSMTYPWMAMIEWTNNGLQVVASGALINERYVLTAAHNVLYDRKLYTIKLGIDNDLRIQCYKAEEFILNNWVSSRTYAADIALIKLHTKVNFGYNIAPICLPPVNADEPEDDYCGRTVMIAGWGKKSAFSPVSCQLLEASVITLSNYECRRWYQNIMEVQPQILCTKGNKDIYCEGDSGGPVMLNDHENRWYVIGVISYIDQCCDDRLPEVHVRTLPYLPWIMKYANITPFRSKVVYT